MTKLATRKKEVENLEGIKIEIFDSSGNPMDLNTQGIPAYKYIRKASGTTTVVEFRARFEQAYPGLTCDVLEPSGQAAHGNKQLNKLR
ncbi:hypothetical protein [Billgrantia endophytica]|uniref:Uncharacterized protein n=1 Tax=Billgrantia endophytica TaxID=2033802 RepID=A0A2N7U0U0_9GAMM|nr:hypothetical protein [Halomonas endophytica]PMR74056.1 hypothetical protein C1H69_15415 [Halomonas endophytica]